ncbi:hypothetical protein PIB30_030758 [Stylosanthes scabra]|uniref:Reverse transcriptase domain-containing protein n=1 Tax=Stylosanthes scabra TaxID=79078 RepID=A0ABU6XA47_9FABA|nr:hypothetical protein [Stylosanthes scabra]
MVNQDEEGVAYTDHSGDERRTTQQQNQQQDQQRNMDHNATANGSTASGDRNVESGGKTQNGQPKPHDDNPGGWRSTSAFDRLGPGDPDPNPFGGIGSDESRITHELQHRMQSVELMVQELRKENVELRNVTKDLKSRRRSPPRRRSRYKSRSPPRRRPQTPPRRQCHPSSSEDGDSSSDDSRETRRRPYRRYKRTKDREKTPPVDGHTPFLNRVFKVQLPKGFIKPTDLKYDGSTDPHVHLNDFEHQMICDGAIDEVKCRVSSLPGDLDRTSGTVNPNETTRKYIEWFNAECKTIVGLVDGVASLCLTNGLANDDFKKQLTAKPVWTRKEMQAKAKEFIHHEEVNRVVAATKSLQTETAPRGNSTTQHPRDNQRDHGFRGNSKFAKQK